LSGWGVRELPHRNTHHRGIELDSWSSCSNKPAKTRIKSICYRSHSQRHRVRICSSTSACI